MVTVVRMPSVLANATEGAIQAWLMTEGQSVTMGEPLVEIETEKAVVEYAAEVDGTVGKLLVSPGANVAVGTPIAVILATGEGPDDIGPALEAAGATVEGSTEQPSLAEPTTPVPATSASSTSAESPASVESERSDATGRRFVSPIVRRLARERGIDLRSVVGTGSGGRVVRRDLDAVADVPVPPSPEHTAAASTAGYSDLPLSGMRRAIARRLTESKSTVPHFYVTAHVTVDRLLELRGTINESAPRKISVNDLIVKAVGAALVEVPAANAIWRDDHIRRFDGVDIAVAVAVDNGLLTPVLRGVDRSTLTQLSENIAELAERARAGRLRQDELEGGSFSVSNLGMYGVDEFSAILNPPQSGILAVSAAKPRPIVDDSGALAVATVMTVTLSADHRVIDGAVAAEWMAAFVRLVENPVRILV